MTQLDNVNIPLISSNLMRAFWNKSIAPSPNNLNRSLIFATSSCFSRNFC